MALKLCRNLLTRQFRFSPSCLTSFARAKHNNPCSHEEDLPRCSKERLAVKKDCDPRAEFANTEIPFHQFYKDCCDPPCPDVYPRFDDLYYRSSDKSKREYKQTWPECKDPVRIRNVCVKKIVCPPPICRRDKSKSCEQQSQCARQVCPKPSDKCPRLKWGKCPRGRIPPICRVTRGLKDCKKRCAPYPSLSECSKPKIRPLHPRECNCMEAPMMCEVYAYLRKIEALQGFKPKTKEPCKKDDGCKTLKPNPCCKTQVCDQHS